MEDPHWVEYVGAIGGFLGVVIATLAAWFAWKSGAAADRTAVAAERTASAAEEESKASRELVEMQRAEHEAFIEERARAPKLDAKCRLVKGHKVTHGPYRAILEIGWTNIGTKDLVGAGFNLIVPDDVALWRSDALGEVRPLPSGWLMPAHQHELSEGVGSHYLNHAISAPIGQPTVTHVALDLPEPGRYPIELKIWHNELQPGVRWFVLLSADARVGDMSLAPLDPADLPIARKAVSS